MQPWDMPDNYPWLVGSGRSAMADMGELAVRLGSPVAYDRRGTVFWMWNGDNGLSPWGVVEHGTGAVVRVNATTTDLGAYAIEIKAGSDGNHAARIYRYFAPLELRRIGVEASVILPTENEEFSVRLYRYDGATRTEGRAILNKASDKLQIWGAAGSAVDVADLPDDADPAGIYHHVKLVVDLEAGTYVRILYDENEYDVSDQALYAAADTVKPGSYLALWLIGRSGQNDRAQVGRCILTIGEP